MGQTDYQWLRRLRLYWILPAESISTILLAAALFGIVVLKAFGKHDLAMQWLIGTLCSSFASAMLHHVLFYRCIRCPQCLHNPTRSGCGKNLPRNQAWAHLKKLDACPHCASLDRAA